MSKLLKGLFRFVLFSSRGAGDELIEGPFPSESQMPQKKRNNKRKASNRKQSKSPNTERPMASDNGKADMSSGAVSTDEESSNSEVTRSQSPDARGPPMTGPATNHEPPSDVGNTSVDGHDGSGDESTNGVTVAVADEQSTSPGLPFDVSSTSMNGREPSGDDLVSMGKQDSEEQSMYVRVKVVEDDNKIDVNMIQRLKEQLSEQENAIKDLTKEVHALRLASRDVERAREKYKGEVTVLEEVHSAAVQKLKEEHDRVVTEMKTHHELEVHTKDAEVIQAKDETIRREAESREKEREEREAGMQTIVKLLEGLDRKFDERVGKLENSIATEVIPAVRQVDQNITTVDGKVGGLEKLIENKRQEDRNNQLDMEKKMGGVAKEVGDVRQTVDFLKQHGGQQHEEIKRGIDNAVAKIGEQIENSMKVMMENERQQAEGLQQTIQGLHGEISTSLAGLTTAVQGGQNNNVLHAIGHLRQHMEDKIGALAQSLRTDGNGRSEALITEVMGNMKQWIENLTFKTEKTNFVKISRP